MNSIARRSRLAILLTIAACPLPGKAQEPRAAIVAPATRPADGMLERLSDEISDAGYKLERFGPAQLCDPERLKPSGLDLLLICDASALPAAAVKPVSEFLEGGGDLIALRTPMWQQPLVEAEGRWLTADAYMHARAGRLPENVLFRFTPEEFAAWQVSRYGAHIQTLYETIAEGPAARQRALHVRAPDLDGWDTVITPTLEKPFPAGHTLTVFSARGTEETPQLAVEWMEKDGSRWIAVVALSTEWSQHVLKPRDFLYWASNPARGHGGDHLRVENAVRFSVGVAFSHTGRVPGPQEYWLGPVGTAAPTGEYAQLLDVLSPPALDTLSPVYKLFDCTGVSGLREVSPFPLVDGSELPTPQRLRSPQPRPQAAGFDKGRAWRWIPLLEARTAADEWRGTPATLMLQHEGTHKGGIWASFGVEDAGWYENPKVLRAIGTLAKRIREGVFLIDGGADHYTYFENQPISAGVNVCNLDRERRHGLTARVVVTSPDSDKPVFEKQWTFDVDAGATLRLAESWTPPGWTDRGFQVAAEVLVSGQVIDRAVHQVHVWRPKERKQFVTVETGDFVLDGRRWRAHGINYMPSSGIATEDYGFFEHWLGARSYDPEVIQRDLEHIRDMGMNSVSIFIDHLSMKAQNLLDLLRRLDLLGMKANLMIRPSHPMNYDGTKVREVIAFYRLAENDTLFAYDLDWEPMFRGHEERRPWDRHWEGWIVERYGSVASAEKDWKFAVPRTQEGAVTNPLPHQIDTDGEWRSMTAAYRRFADTLLYRKYSAAARFVRSLDPNHQISFRKAEAGNPTMRYNGWMPYDFPYLAHALDFLSPEAYGRIGDWERVRDGWFEYEYGRWAAPDKPFVWAEMGMSAWDLGRRFTSPALLETQAQYYRDFYRMMISSGADGIYFWWYPGGFRLIENSDYGIINPDGSDRPVTRVIRDHARKFLDGPDARPIDHWIEIDRDAHPDGIAGIYDQVKKEFWSAIEAGRAPGLRTAGTGTNSTNCPLVAVGNTPCTGTNPPKYLDAAFDSVEVLAVDGRWTAVPKGGRVEVDGSRPVLARVEVTNLGEAAWVSLHARDSVDGGIFLVSTSEPPVRVALPLEAAGRCSARWTDVVLAAPPLNAEHKVTLTFEAHGRTAFGEKYDVLLVPR